MRERQKQQRHCPQHGDERHATDAAVKSGTPSKGRFFWPRPGPRNSHPEKANKVRGLKRTRVDQVWAVLVACLAELLICSLFFLFSFFFFFPLFFASSSVLSAAPLRPAPLQQGWQRRKEARGSAGGRRELLDVVFALLVSPAPTAVESMLLLCLLAVGAVLGQSATDPNCPKDFPIQATSGPDKGKTFKYNVQKFKVDDTDLASFISGKEGTSPWTAYVNVCGNTQAVGCTSPTPVCQNDGSNPPKYVSMGDPTTWTMTAYYEPIAGPSTLIWDGGIFVNVKNGEPCETAGPRQSNLFLKCDKTVKTRPTTVQIAEKNPSTGQGTTCNYWFDPIA